MWEVWLQQNPQEISSNGTTVQFLQKDESLFQALYIKTSASPTEEDDSQVSSDNLGQSGHESPLFV